MKKLHRFFVVCLLFISLWAIAYSVIPTLVLIFGGSFKAVVQHPIYIFFIGIISLPLGLASIFYECFDKNFYSKTK